MRIGPVMRRLVLATALAAVGLIQPGLAPAGMAQSTANWPDKPVRLILNFAPGGGIDNGTRPYTEPLQRLLGSPSCWNTRPARPARSGWRPGPRPARMATTSSRHLA